MNRLIAFSADDAHAATLAAWRDASPGPAPTPACVLIYEQFVCTSTAQAMGRILTYSVDLLRAEVRRLARLRLLRDGDIVVRNVEDGHPADGPSYREVHRRYAQDLRAVLEAEGLACQTAAYGLFKRRMFKSAGMGAVHHRGYVPFAESDAAAAEVTALDDYGVAELYCAYPSIPDGSAPRSDTMPRSQQRRWLAEQARDVARLGGRPVLSLACPFYTHPAMKGRMLHSEDRRAVLDAAAGLDAFAEHRARNLFALWAHLGPATGGLHAETVRAQAEGWGIRIGGTR